MKQFLLIFILFLFFEDTGFAQKKSTSSYKLIKAYITETSDYCGGAMPSEEKLKYYKTPRPLADKEIFIKIGTRNSAKAYIKKVKTDDRGFFSVRLKSGSTYCFLEDWKAKPFKIPDDTKDVTWDAVCFKKRYETADYILRVMRSGNAVVKINYHTPCFFKPYCGNYTGPIPP